MGVLTPRGKPFYGWTVAGVLCVFGAVGVGLAGANFALFIVPMTEELGWSSSTFGWAFFLRFLVILAAGPLIGRLIDLPEARACPSSSRCSSRERRCCGSRASPPRGSWPSRSCSSASWAWAARTTCRRARQSPSGSWRRRGLAMGVALAGTPARRRRLLPGHPGAHRRHRLARSHDRARRLRRGHSGAARHAAAATAGRTSACCRTAIRRCPAGRGRRRVRRPMRSGRSRAARRCAPAASGSCSRASPP